MLKKAGLVDDNNNPNMATLTSYGDVLGLKMPARASNDRQRLRVLVRNAERIRDAVVRLANNCDSAPSSHIIN